MSEERAPYGGKLYLCGKDLEPGERGDGSHHFLEKCCNCKMTSCCEHVVVIPTRESSEAEKRPLRLVTSSGVSLGHVSGGESA